jgi:hypothetical protein
MGSKKKKSAAPKAPAPPPTATDVEFVAPTVTQRIREGRGSRAAYLTKGQRLGAGGARLGSGASEQSDIADRMMVDDTERMGDIGEFKGQKTYRGKRRYRFAGPRKEKDTAAYTIYKARKAREKMTTGTRKQAGMR